ncbi:dephospho-CoA kinase [Aquincola sp. MAHUQ-54]|uniref:Dephospho-CoA kinase n=1 Tax=Aquincola agrisoli TaxID=3119538 RepID=A0AAW9QF84_9BURK
MGLKIGLTGGIGSGKSTVAARLVARGAVLVDTDAISRALTAVGGAALPALAAAFGAAAIGADGALDRDHMRQLVFADPAARHRLEGILHPMIGAETLRQAAAAGEHTVVFDVPLLAESGHWRGRVDKVLVVDCSEATQLARVMRRSGWARDTVERVIAQQATRAARRAIADAVLHNEGLTLEQLDTQVHRLWHCWHADPVKQ